MICNFLKVILLLVTIGFVPSISGCAAAGGSEPGERQAE